jgi:hypothetical protein
MCIRIYKKAMPLISRIEITQIIKNNTIKEAWWQKADPMHFALHNNLAYTT